MYEEDKLQMQVAQYLDAIGVLWCHVGNERKTSIQAGVRMKRKGVKSGVPDCLIFEPHGNYVGLAIELKVKRDNGLKKNGQPRKPTIGKLSENQKYWKKELERKGWRCIVAYSLDDVINVCNFLK